MSDSAFIKAIRAHPEDDVPRLVYADWLEEHGNPIRAEFIRVQCELASTPEHDPRYRILEDREHEILSEYEPQFLGSGWPKDWPLGPSEWSWRRGFLDDVTINFGNLLNAGYLSEHPVRSLSISSDFGQPTELLERTELWPMLEGLQGIDFSGWGNLEHEGLKGFFNSDLMERLCDVDFRGTLPHFDVMEILRDCPKLVKRMKRLCTIGDRSASGEDSLLTSAELEERSSISHSAEAAVYAMLQDAPIAEFTQSHLEAIRPELLCNFLASNAAQRLKQLDLSVNGRVHELQAIEGQYALEELHLEDLDYAYGTSTLLHLLYSPLCQSLERLELGYCSISLDESVIFPNSGFSQRAKSLSLHNVRCSKIVWGDLFRHDFFQQLEHLEIHNPEFDSDMWSCLATHPFAEHLTKMTLTAPSISFFESGPTKGNCEFRRLRELRVYQIQGVPEFKYLLSFVTLSSVRLCNFYNSTLADAELIQLLETDGFHPSGLGLHNCRISDSFITSLTHSPKLARLNWLDLTDNFNFTEEALLKLAESPYLSRMCELDLSGCDISDRVREAFQSRLGPRFAG
jgi:uncharacterized protein (TIGR02996 family)